MVVLKIIGIVLLALLGLLLLALIFMLFVPIRYKATATARGFNVEADANLSWLLGIFRMRLVRKAGTEELDAYILWHRIRFKDADTSEEPVEASVVEQYIPSAIQNEAAEISGRSHQTNRIEYEKPSKSSEPESALKKRIKAIRSPGIFARIKDMLNKINFYRTHPDRDAVVSATKVLIKSLCKKLMPNTLRLSGEIGLDEPHKTAYLFAVAGMLFIPMSAVKPNFNEQILSIDLYARGRLSLWMLLPPVLRFAIKRPIRSIIKKILFKKGDANE